MIILDTNVLSEMMKQKPEPRVAAWMAARPRTSLFTTAITQAELLYGVALLPVGRRRDELRDAVHMLFDVDLAGYVLPFDSASARAFADIAAARRRSGLPISQADAQIAAIARSRDASVATRNISDFEGCGFVVHNPWQGGESR